MLLSNRVIYSNNTVLSDFSVSLNKPYSATEAVTIVAAEDYLYVGSDLPFNHRYIEVSTANVNASILTVQYWDGDEWKETIDIMDQTSVAGASLAQSGHISWATPKKEGWVRDDTGTGTGQGDIITGLSTLEIMDLYWIRFTFSADTSATVIKYVGHLFSTDEELGVEYPDLITSEVLDQFKSGKTDWKDQTIKAADEIIRDLTMMNIIFTPNQILEWDRFSSASVHKVAVIIFRSFGDDFKDNLIDAMSSYKKALEMGLYGLDINRNARLDPQERIVTQGFLNR